MYKFSQKSIDKKIQIGSKSHKICVLQIICPVTQKQRVKSKKVHEQNPPQMSQIIIRNHKNQKKNHCNKISKWVLERPPMNIFLQFFSVNRDLIDHFGE